MEIRITGPARRDDPHAAVIAALSSTAATREMITVGIIELKVRAEMRSTFCSSCLRVLAVACALVLGIACRSSSAPTRREAGLNVLLITIDTLRADALGSYGNAQTATPWLDRLAAGGV